MGVGVPGIPFKPERTAPLRRSGVGASVFPGHGNETARICLDSIIILFGRKRYYVWGTFLRRFRALKSILTIDGLCERRNEN